MTQVLGKKDQAVLVKTKDTPMLQPGSILLDIYPSYMQTCKFTQSFVHKNVYTELYS